MTATARVRISSVEFLVAFAEVEPYRYVGHFVWPSSVFKALLAQVFELPVQMRGAPGIDQIKSRVGAPAAGLAASASHGA